MDTFQRNVEIESRNVSLVIHQKETGGVGCVVWDAGLVLAKYIDAQNERTISKQPYFLNKSIIDLGSGTGIVGLAAACVGGHVVLTDLEENEDLLKLNIHQNSHVLLGQASTKVLKWGKENLNSFSPVDILLVGDCLYYEESIKPLVDTLTSLSGPNTEILLSYEDREDEKKIRTQALFMELMKKDFCLEEIHSNDLDPTFQSPDIHVLRIRRKT